MASLFERMRPATWAEVVGQEKALAQIDRYRKGGLGGRCYLLAGPSGCGKTTIARLIASELSGDWGVTELSDPSELTAEVLDRIRLDCARRPFGASVYIVNEIHGLRADQMRKLLGLTESVPEWVTFIFTTSKVSQGALWADMDEQGALQSRCKRIQLVSNEEAFAKRCQEIARAEGMDGKDIQEYRFLVARCKGNMREALNRIEDGAMAI